MSDRLPSRIEADSLIRRVQAGGGFAMLLHRGDADRGTIILAISRKGEHVVHLERGPTPAGEYRWQAVGPDADSLPERLTEWRGKRLRSDPDLWLIELDVPDPERFIAEMTAIG